MPVSSPQTPERIYRVGFLTGRPRQESLNGVDCLSLKLSSFGSFFVERKASASAVIQGLEQRHQSRAAGFVVFKPSAILRQEINGRLAPRSRSPSGLFGPAR